MNIIDLEPYILGDKYIEGAGKEVRCNDKILNKFFEACGTSDTAPLNLDVLGTSSAFYSYEPTVARQIPAKYREEVFFAAKLGLYTDVIPTKYLYRLKQVYDEYGSFNYMSKCLSKSDLNNMFKKGTITDGYCLKDIICSVFQDEYEPLGDIKRSVRIKDYYEIYIEDTDMIALVPEKIGSMLSRDDIYNLTVSKKDIMCGSIPLRYMSSNYLGFCRHMYDLRSLR